MLPSDTQGRNGRGSASVGPSSASSGINNGSSAGNYVPSGFPGGGGYAAHATASSPPAFGGGGAGSSSCSREASAVGGSSRPNERQSSDPATVLYTDSAAAAEWRALYGASKDMLNATAHTFRSGGDGVSFMTPIFHLTAHDASILSMEHNNHCKLLAISTSRNEILVTWTQLMPVIENMGALRGQEEDFFDGGEAPPVDERLLEWDPASMSILIDELPFACTELSWAPWQQGIYLAVLCPGHGIRMYRYSHGHWALDDCIASTKSTSSSISKHFTVACACSRGRLELWYRGATSSSGGGGPSSAAGAGGNNSNCNSSTSCWVLSRTLTLQLHDDEDGVGGGGRGPSTGTSAAPSPGGRHRLRDILSVSWDESGSLLAVGDQGGAVYVVSATHDSTRLGEVVLHQPPAGNTGPCKQVAWAPSSGRSFLSLAMVFANRVKLMLFRRPRFMNAAGLPHGMQGGRMNGGGGGNMQGSGGGGSTPSLELLASTQVPCEEVVKLSWNGTGTRFVTSHLDSAVNIWAVDVRYQHQAKPEGGLAGGRGEQSAGTADGRDTAGRGGHVSSEKRLSLVVSLRRTSSAHPYHASAK